MTRRWTMWALALPLVGVSVLVGHALAYRLTGTPQGPLHEYLDHAPQLLVVLGVVGLCGLALESRSGTPRSLPFTGLGMAVFALQEHLERALHTGRVPVLVTDRTFVVGLALQVPVGLLVAFLARRLVRALGVLRPVARSRGVASLPLVLCVDASAPCRAAVPVRALGRSPPARLAS